MGDGNKSRGRKRKRRVAQDQFRPKRQCVGNEQQDADGDSSAGTSASQRKLNYHQMDKILCPSKDQVKQGFILLDASNLFEFLEEVMRCPECMGKGISCSIVLDKKTGFNHFLDISCRNCHFQSGFETSKKIESKGSGRAMNEVNLRMVSFVRSFGRGYSVLENFSLFLNSPSPMTKRNYKKIFRKLLCANKEVAKESMERAAMEVKNKEEPTNCAVSLDGTWQRRGHASHHGVVTCNLVDTGKCVDIEVLSNFCEGCSYWEDKDRTTREFVLWQEKHSCKANHRGSAGAMEPLGAGRIFQRSEAIHGLRYDKYLGDGDSASYKKVSQLCPYGKDFEIEKLECIGHIQKRCGTRLRRLKKENKNLRFSDGKGLSGTGRLTEKMIDTLQNYYGFAIRQNSGNLEGMQQSVSAILPHVASTAKNKMHDNCPDGHNSWCGFKRNPDTYKHKAGLPMDIYGFIKPVFDDLSSPDLLKKCLHGKSQNGNECLNKLIWDRCSKEYFVEKDVIEDACYSAVSHFNDGRDSVIKMFQKLNIFAGHFTEDACKQQNAKRVRKSLEKSSYRAKARRKTLRARKKGFADNNSLKEGNIYEAGAH